MSKLEEIIVSILTAWGIAGGMGAAVRYLSKPLIDPQGVLLESIENRNVRPCFVHRTKLPYKGKNYETFVVMSPLWNLIHAVYDTERQIGQFKPVIGYFFDHPRTLFETFIDTSFERLVDLVRASYSISHEEPLHLYFDEKHVIAYLDEDPRQATNQFSGNYNLYLIVLNVPEELQEGFQRYLRGLSLADLSLALYEERI